MNPRAPLALALALTACDELPARSVAPTDATLADAPVDATVDGTAGPSGIGTACTVDTDCVRGQACLAPSNGFPGGYCTLDCRLTPCPADSYCVGDGARQYCLQRCDGTVPCRLTDGYVCAHPSQFLPRGCVPDPSPVGHGDDGGCVAPDAASLPQPALFLPMADSVSHDRTDSDTEADPTLAVSPVDGTVVVAYLARDARGNFFSGVSHLSPGSTAWSQDGTVTDHDFDNALDPVVAYDRTGGLYLSYLGQTISRPQPAVRVARSMDRGATFPTVVRAEPTGRCNGGCDPPWLTAGPGPDPTRDALYLAYVTRSTHRDGWVSLQRSDDHGATFGAATVAGQVETLGTTALDPYDPRVAVGPDGTVHATWVLQHRDNPRAPLGDALNAVRYARSTDGAQGFTVPVAVSVPGESVVIQPAPVAPLGNAVAVAYVSGTPDGRWDVILATTTDGGVHFTRRRVNDDPLPCATHGFAALAADPARAVWHVVWLDNRTGDGEVVYARCPADPTAPCALNTLVSAVPYRFSTSADPTLWHGTHSALTVAADGTLWAAWSDTRTGGPAVYVAHAPPRP